MKIGEYIKSMMDDNKPSVLGNNCVIGNNVTFGENVSIGHNCIIEDNVCLGKNVNIDSNIIIRSGVAIDDGTSIGANCIIGECGTGSDRTQSHEWTLKIGKNGLIRSGTIIYNNSRIGNNFQTGHQATIRENSDIGNNVSVGTHSDIQGDCSIGDYVRIHSNVFVAPLSKIDSYVWLFPHVILTNDPTPPSEKFVGVHVNSFAIVAAGAIVLPGIEIEHDSLVGAGALVTTPVKAYQVVVGNPARVVNDVRNIKSKFTGEPVYPWREHFKRAMPWNESGFVDWYAALSVEEKENYNLGSAIIE